MREDNKLIDAGINAISAITNEAYKDLAQPAVRRIGHALGNLTKITLSPIALLDYGFEQSKDWLNKKIEERISNIPDEFITTPPNNISVPLLNRIAISCDTPELRDLYAELLLKAIDSRTASLVHPSYAYVIEQLSPEEALLFISLHEKSDKTIFTEKFESAMYRSPPSIEEQFHEYCESIGIENNKNSQVWFENLTRLSLLQIINYSEPQLIPKRSDKYGIIPARVDTTEYRYLEFTAFGQGFIEACSPI